MLPLRYLFRWRVAGVALLIFVLLCTLLPAIWFRTHFRFDTVGIDKVAHMLAFLTLALWFSGQYARESWWRIILGLSIFGVIIEVCQMLTVSRSAEWLDLLADLVGIAVGLLIARAGIGGWSLRLENWLLERGRAR
ncbi:MAG: VanZ family protein [Woeseia sp.]|nr:VanZ family protein [Woeseia sp.]MBT8095660.1 VanZ family protein [Woeseia sp.]NNE59450.1 VanZ family protein [Woeseia sp.]NNL54644.1 VanZ family protein [Woeseia sp.]